MERWRADESRIVQSVQLADGENSAPGELSRVGPVVHDSSANEQIVLMVIRAVIESSEVIVDLDDANGEMSIKGDIDAPTEMRRKLRPAVWRQASAPDACATPMRSSPNGCGLCSPFNHGCENL